MSCHCADGTYFGWRSGSSLYTHDGRHVGQFRGREIVAPNGRYLGEMDGGRLVTNIAKKTRKSIGFVPGIRMLSPYTVRPSALRRVMLGEGFEDFPRPDEL